MKFLVVSCFCAFYRLASAGVVSSFGVLVDHSTPFLSTADAGSDAYVCYNFWETARANHERPVFFTCSMVLIVLSSMCGVFMCLYQNWTDKRNQPEREGYGIGEREESMSGSDDESIADDPNLAPKCSWPRLSISNRLDEITISMENAPVLRLLVKTLLVFMLLVALLPVGQLLPILLWLQAKQECDKGPTPPVKPIKPEPPVFPDELRTSAPNHEALWSSNIQQIFSDATREEKAVLAAYVTAYRQYEVDFRANYLPKYIAYLRELDIFFQWELQVKISTQLPFAIETCVEAIPQSLLQSTAIVINSQRGLEISWSQFISIGISMVSIASKAYIACSSLVQSMFYFKFLCFTYDIAALFYTVATFWSIRRGDPGAINVFFLTRPVDSFTAVYLWMLFVWSCLFAIWSLIRTSALLFEWFFLSAGFEGLVPQDDDALVDAYAFSVFTYMAKIWPTKLSFAFRDRKDGVEGCWRYEDSKCGYFRIFSSDGKLICERKQHGETDRGELFANDDMWHATLDRSLKEVRITLDNGDAWVTLGKASSPVVEHTRTKFIRAAAHDPNKATSLNMAGFFLLMWLLLLVVCACVLVVIMIPVLLALLGLHLSWLCLWIKNLESEMSRPNKIGPAPISFDDLCEIQYQEALSAVYGAPVFGTDGDNKAMLSLASSPDRFSDFCQVDGSMVDFLASKFPGLRGDQLLYANREIPTMEVKLMEDDNYKEYLDEGAQKSEFYIAAFAWAIEGDDFPVRLSALKHALLNQHGDQAETFYKTYDVVVPCCLFLRFLSYMLMNVGSLLKTMDTPRKILSPVSGNLFGAFTSLSNQFVNFLDYTNTDYHCEVCDDVNCATRASIIATWYGGVRTYVMFYAWVLVPLGYIVQKLIILMTFLVAAYGFILPTFTFVLACYEAIQTNRCSGIEALRGHGKITAAEFGASIKGLFEEDCYKHDGTPLNGFRAALFFIQAFVLVLVFGYYFFSAWRFIAFALLITAYDVEDKEALQGSMLELYKRYYAPDKIASNFEIDAADVAAEPITAGAAELMTAGP